MSVCSDVPKLTTAGNFVSGALTSFCNITACHPLFTVKTFVMAGRGFPRLSQLPLGYGANLTCDISNQAVAFGAYGIYQRIMMGDRTLSSTEQFIGGLFAGAAASPLLAGLERVMIIQQLSGEEKGSLRRTAMTSSEVILAIKNTEGLSGFMRGMVPTILRESTNSACFFGLSKMIRSPVSRVVSDERVASMLSYLGAGAIAGFATTPFDLAKTLKQKDITANPVPMLTLLRDAADKNGGFILRALYKGAGPRVVMIASTMTGMGYFSERIPHHLPGIFLIKRSEIRGIN